MGRQLDYAVARQILDEEFPRAEEMFLDTARPDVPEEIITATKRLFSSATQAFREALIGVAVARATDPEIDIRFPYMNQAENSFNGRTLDNRVVNPFLVEHEVPCSTGPYLSSIRRNVTFEEATIRGVRDKAAFRALLEIIKYPEQQFGRGAAVPQIPAVSFRGFTGCFKHCARQSPQAQPRTTRGLYRTTPQFAERWSHPGIVVRGNIKRRSRLLWPAVGNLMAGHKRG